MDGPVGGPRPRALARAWYAQKRWLYRGGRPHGLARALNDVWGRLYARGWLSLGRGATLQVRGRTTGRTLTLPVVVAEHRGAHYLVSMLGDDAGWVRNVRADDGRATLVAGGRARAVRLVEVPVDDRPEILRRYLDLAPGARPHVPVARTAPLADFRRVAADFPVFRVEERPRQ
ncbi:nitroreductase/quinone reductase family protein [Cellulomonas sp. H30R-01]|uniref:nitroreductase/quinone reductase family protein n=1 Tax=Cellulomonas sp. H30R-01 TaxID=2704467 RepID=UPI001EE42581|nr:nitroreductase/quinone reductase family protein [Cellulomonas sp. H30R-01]